MKRLDLGFILLLLFSPFAHSTSNLRCDFFLNALPEIVATFETKDGYAKRRADGSGSSGGTWFFHDFTIWYQYLVAVSEDLGEIHFYDLRSGALVAKHIVSLEGESPAFTNGTFETYEMAFDKSQGLYVISSSGMLFHADLRSLLKDGLVKPRYNIAERAKFAEYFNPSTFRMAQNSSRVFIDFTSLHDRAAKVSGVFDLQAGNWLRSFKRPHEGHFEREFRMSPDGKQILTYTQLHDDESAASFAARNHEHYRRHNLDLNTRFPKALIDVDTGASIAVEYPAEFNEVLNTRYVGKLQFTDKPQVLRALLRGDELFVDFDAQSGKVISKRSAKIDRYGTYISSDGSLLIKPDGNAEDTRLQAFSFEGARATRLASFPKAPNGSNYLADSQGFYLVSHSARGFTIYRTRRAGVLGDVIPYESLWD
jgi:hypothetical protein